MVDRECLWALRIKGGRERKEEKREGGGREEEGGGKGERKEKKGKEEEKAGTEKVKDAHCKQQKKTEKTKLTGDYNMRPS